MKKRQRSLKTFLADMRLQMLDFRLSAPARFIGGLGALIFLGAFLLRLPVSGGETSLTFREAFFTSVSALTVTGLSTITPGVDLSIFGQLVVLALIQLGGVGIMVGVVFILGVLGRRISYLDRAALTDQMGLMNSGQVISLAWALLRVTLVIEAIGAMLLWALWAERLGTGRALYYAIFHAVSAFCNAGFDLFGSVPGGFPTDTPTLLVFGGLIFVGGLGLPLILDLSSWDFKRRLSLHTRLTLIVVVVLVFLGGMGIFITERNGGVLADVPTLRGLALAFFQSISVRTAGFAGLSPFESLAPASKLLMMMLMFIGCAPVSMGGGITTGTFTVLILGSFSYIRNHKQIIIMDRSLAEFSMRRAAAVLTVSLGVVGLATWLILMTHPATLDQALFEVISAFATCGLTLSFTGQLNGFGQFVIMLVMFWGRLGPLTLLATLGRSTRTTHLTYPQEDVFLG